MLDDFKEASAEQLSMDIDKLRASIQDGTFTSTAGNSFDISPDALIKLSDEVDVRPSPDRPKPTFDLMISPDPLTIRVANRLYPELIRMGFQPVFLIGQYKMPKAMQHPQLSELSFQSQVFNQTVLTKLRHATVDPTHQFLSPAHLAQVKGLKVISDISSVNEHAIRQYIESEDKNVGIAHSFRLYDLIGRDFIEMFSQVSDDGLQTQWGIGSGHVRNTCFSSPYFNGVHSVKNGSKDNGQRRSLVTNIHPSLTDHGVIPPFWTQLRMYELMDHLGVDYNSETPKNIAKICERFAEDNPDSPLRVSPYLSGMVHHVEPRFDTGARIVIGQNSRPVDLTKPMWENYFGMEEMIVKSTLAMAAAYKLGLDLSGHNQDLNKTMYHSYPGQDSTPPSYMDAAARSKIKDRDSNALSRFEDFGGTLVSKDHFNRIIFGDPETGTRGFAVRGTELASSLEADINTAYRDRKIINGNYARIGGGGGEFLAAATGSDRTGTQIQIAGANDFSANDNDWDQFPHFGRGGPVI